MQMTNSNQEDCNLLTENESMKEKKNINYF